LNGTIPFFAKGERSSWSTSTTRSFFLQDIYQKHYKKFSCSASYTRVTIFGLHKSDISKFSIVYKELEAELADLHNKEVSFFTGHFSETLPTRLSCSASYIRVKMFEQAQIRHFHPLRGV
jgi:hypothetical protein